MFCLLRIMFNVSFVEFLMCTKFVMLAMGGHCFFPSRIQDNISMDCDRYLLLFGRAQNLYV